MRDKQEETISFSSDESDSHFVKLMEYSGVNPKSSVQIEELELRLPSTPKPKYYSISRKTVPKRVHQKIKVSRKLQIDNRLDLHGETQESSLKCLERFMWDSISRHDKVLLIITGKGLNSAKKGGVLRKITQNWLDQNSAKIREFGPAPSYFGGRGAFLVFLK
jgi:DNA-nicking Smr family endonuclease